jgi:hypothetical protein
MPGAMTKIVAAVGLYGRAAKIDPCSLTAAPWFEASRRCALCVQGDTRQFLPLTGLGLDVTRP